MQKMCELKFKVNTEGEVLKEKYKVLKNEYLDLQQKMHMYVNCYEKQLDELKRNCIMQDKEIQHLRMREYENQQQLLVYEEKIERLICDVRLSEEGKIEMKNKILLLSDQMKVDKNKLNHLKDLIRISIKQVKNEFFQNVKVVHRLVFEEFTAHKKFIMELSQAVFSKVNLTIKSMSSTISLQRSQQKQYQERFFKEAEELNALKLLFSQLRREISIRDDRIIYLENALTHR